MGTTFCRPGLIRDLRKLAELQDYRQPTYDWREAAKARQAVFANYGKEIDELLTAIAAADMFQFVPGGANAPPVIIGKVDIVRHPRWVINLRPPTPQ